MLILAIDTTSRPGSIALAQGATLLEEWVGPAGMSHGQRLLGDIVDLLARHDVSLASIDVYAVAAGPGSFTGLRVGIATMQGLAFAQGRPMVGVSALEALAFASRQTAQLALSPSFLLGAWMDAQRGEVFTALYQAGDRPFLTEIDAAAVDHPEAVLRSWAPHLAHPGNLFFTGDGATGYRDVIEQHVSGARIVAPVPPLAGAIAKLAREADLRGEAVAPHAVRPLYVRRPDAELARAKRS